MADLQECYAVSIGGYHVSGQLVGLHFFNASLLKTGPTRCPQMLKSNYKPMQEKIQEERIPQTYAVSLEEPFWT
jgi:hypothetical protein